MVAEIENHDDCHIVGKGSQFKYLAGGETVAEKFNCYHYSYIFWQLCC